MKRSYVIFLLFVIILAGCGGSDRTDEPPPAAPEEMGTLPTDPTTDANTRVATNTPPTPPAEVRIKTVSLSKCFVGEMCTRKIEADGASAYKWDIGHPEWFTLTESENSQKVTLRGTPPEAGKFKIEVRVSDRTDETRRARQRDLNLVVSRPTQRELGLEDDVPQECFYGEDCEGSLTATGGSKKYTWVRSGQLPDGLKWELTQDGRVGISGRPTKLGTFQIKVKLTDQEDENAIPIERDIELTVRDRVEIKFYSPANGGWKLEGPENPAGVRIPSGGELKVEVTGHAPRYAATLNGSPMIAWDCDTERECMTSSGGLVLSRYSQLFTSDELKNAIQAIRGSSVVLAVLKSKGIRTTEPPPNSTLLPRKTFYLTADESSLGRKFEGVKIDVEDEYGNKNPPTKIKSIVFEAPVVPPPPPLTVKPSFSFTKKIGDPSDMDSAVSCNEDPKNPSVVTKIYINSGFYPDVYYMRLWCKGLSKLSDQDTEATPVKEGWGKIIGDTKDISAPQGFAFVGWRTLSCADSPVASFTPYAKKVDEFGVHDEIVWRGPTIGKTDESGCTVTDDNICPDGEVLIGGMGGGTDKLRYLTGICGRLANTTQRPNVVSVQLEKPQAIELTPAIGDPGEPDGRHACRTTCWDEAGLRGVVVGVDTHYYYNEVHWFGLHLLCAEVSQSEGGLVYKNASRARVLEAKSIGGGCGSWTSHNRHYLNLGSVATGFSGGVWPNAGGRHYGVTLLSAPLDVFDFQDLYEETNGWPKLTTPRQEHCPEGSVLTGITFTNNNSIYGVNGISGITSFECAKVNIVEE